MGRLQAKRRIAGKIRQRTRQLRDHEDATIDSFRRDPEFAAFHLNAVLADGTQEEMMLTLRRMSAAFGGIAALATRAKLNPTTIYRTLSARGNPELRSIRALLSAMGLRLAVVPARPPARPARSRTA